MQYKVIFCVASFASLVACAPAQVPTVDDAASSVMMDNGAMMDDGDPMMGGNSMMNDGGMMDDGSMAAPRVVDVMVTDWLFSPTMITARKGERVSLRLVGNKGIHSLLVADLGLNVRVSSGESTIVAIPTDTVGTFAGRCGVPCGPGHRDMAFTIVVE